MKLSTALAPAALAAALLFSGVAAAPADAATPHTTHAAKCPGHKDPRGYIWAGSCYWWPGYDTDTSGTHQSYNPRLADAWESFDALTSPPLFDDTHILAYVSTSHKVPHKRKGYITIKSVNHSHTWITFKYVKPRHHH